MSNWAHDICGLSVMFLNTEYMIIPRNRIWIKSGVCYSWTRKMTCTVLCQYMYSPLKKNIICNMSVVYNQPDTGLFLVILFLLATASLIYNQILVLSWNKPFTEVNTPFLPRNFACYVWHISGASIHFEKIWKNRPGWI